MAAVGVGGSGPITSKCKTGCYFMKGLLRVNAMSEHPFTGHLPFGEPLLEEVPSTCQPLEGMYTWKSCLQEDI